MYSRGPLGYPPVRLEGKPTVLIRWKAIALNTQRQVFRTPPGSETRACTHRGSSGTWEVQMFPCYKNGVGHRTQLLNVLALERGALSLPVSEIKGASKVSGADSE